MTDINKTFLTLNPKLDVVSSMKQFCPISLSNVSYKTVTKIIATRLKAHLDHLIGPTQCAFTPRRQGQDNIIVAQEFFHSMRCKKDSLES